MFAQVEADGVAEKSVMSFQTQNSQRDRLKHLLSEQIQINEKLEIENEMNKIKLRQAMKLLKSKLFSGRPRHNHKKFEGRGLRAHDERKRAE